MKNYKLPLEKIKNREKFDLAETLSWLNTFCKSPFTVDEDEVIVHGDLHYALRTMYFPLKVKWVTGNLTVSNVGLSNDLISLPRKIDGSLSLTGNSFQEPFNFPQFNGELNLSSNRNLNSLDKLKMSKINGDLLLINCNFTRIEGIDVEKIVGSINLSDNKLQSISVFTEIGKDVILSNNLLTYEPSFNMQGTLYLDGNPVHPDDQLEKSMWG